MSSICTNCGGRSLLVKGDFEVEVFLTNLSVVGLKINRVAVSKAICRSCAVSISGELSEDIKFLLENELKTIMSGWERAKNKGTTELSKALSKERSSTLSKQRADRRRVLDKSPDNKQSRKKSN